MNYTSIMKRIKPSLFVKLPGDFAGLGIEEFYAVCEMSNVGLIVLEHGTKRGRTYRSGSSFQGVEIRSVGGRNEPDKFKALLTKDVEGENTMLARNIIFHPCGIINSLLAIVPDTPLNRDLIAAHIGFKNPLYTVHESTENYKELRSALLRIKEEKFKDNKPKTILEKNSEMEDENAKLKLQLAQVNQDLELANASRNVVSTLDPKITGKLKAEAQEEIFNENAEVIDQLKKKSNGWKNTKVYKNIANELVERRFNEKMLKFSQELRSSQGK